MAAPAVPATPLSPNECHSMLAYLSQALNQNTAVQKQAEQLLSSLEHRPGFCSCLADVIADKEVDHSARYLASVHFKNSISRNWRPRHDHQSISADEKTYLRQKLAQLIPQEDNQIALQVALVYAKVARVDYPKDWPTLFQDLMANLSSSNLMTTRRVYLILHHILKELSSKRLLADQKNFAQIAELLFSHVWNEWCAHTSTLLSQLPPALQQPQTAQPLLLTFERWMLLLKILRRLILHGFQSDALSLQPVEAVKLCVPPMVQALQQLVAVRPARRMPRSHLLAMLERGILKLVKTQSQLQETHPWSYQATGMLLPMMEFCSNQVMSTEEWHSDANSHERFLVHCMTFLINIMSCGPYKGKGQAFSAATKQQQDGTIKQMAAEVQQAIRGFWHSQDRLAIVAQSLITHHFVLTTRDLEEWAASAEEWHHTFDAAAWQDSLHLCAENLFQTLLQAYREQLAPGVVSLLSAASASCPTGVDLAALPGARVHGIPSALLYKEAVYNAIAVGAYELHDFVSYTPWLRSTLLPELSDARPSAWPLRRRVAKVIGSWVARLEKDDRPAVYQGLLSLLSHQDACLKLTAIEALRCVIDDFNFDDAQFVEFVAPCMQLLFSCIADFTELDSQMQAFNLLNMLIERMGDNIRPYVEPTLALLPQLWAQAEGQSLLRMQILLAMQRLINVMGPESPRAYSLLLPALQYTLDIQQPESLNLLEDGLGLWLVALRNAPAGELALLQFVPFLTAITTASTEHIQLSMQILTSCLLLARAMLIQQHHAHLLSILGTLIGNVNERGMLLIFPVMDTTVQACPDIAPQVLQPVLAKLLGLMLAGQETSLVVANAMTVFARVLLHSPSQFTECFSQAAAAGVAPPASSQSSQPADLSPGERLLSSFLSLWLDSFDSIGQPAARKLCALALCSALCLPSKVILQHLDLMLTCISSVWYEQEGGGDGERVVYGYDYYSAGRGLSDEIMEGPTAAIESEDAAGESDRKKQLSESDPVNQLQIGSSLKAKLQACAQLHGDAFHAAFAQLDGTVAQQVKSAMGMQ